MNDEQKKFSIVEIVISLLLVGSNALFKLVADLIVAVPVVGQVTFASSEVYTFSVWATIIIWFTMKLGAFGAVGTATTIGGTLDLLGLPIGLFAAVVFAIIFTNYPRVAKVAAVATGKGTSAGAAEREAVAAQKTAVAEAGGAARGSAAAETETTAEGSVGAGRKPGTAGERGQAAEKEAEAGGNKKKRSLWRGARRGKIGV